MGFGNTAAIQADVEFRANYAQFEGDTAKIRESAERTYGALDQGALKAALASEKYDRALARSKGSAYAVAKATAAYKADLASLEATQNRATSSATRHGHALQDEERSLGRVARGAIVGSGALGHLGRAAIFASSSLLGGYGLVYGFRTVIGAAKEQEVALAHLQVAVTDSGLTWTATKGRVDDALSSLVKTTAFTKDDLTEALATAVRRFGDVDQAVNVTALATDVARAKNIDLASAMNLVIRASFGQSRAAKALGVDVATSSKHLDQLRATTKNATAEQIANAKAADQQANRTAYLDQIQAKYHGNAARYLQTSAGKQALFNAELRNSEEIIGSALLPTFNHYLGDLSTWLDKMNRSGKLQRDVNTAVHDGVVVIHGLGTAVHTVTGLLGGFSNTLEALILLKFGMIVFGWAGKLTAFNRTLRGTAAAEKAVTAANAAGTVEGIGGAAAGAAGEVRGLRGALLALASPEVLAAIAVTGAAFLGYEIYKDSRKTHTVGTFGGGGQDSVVERGGVYYKITRTAGRGGSAAHMTRISKAEAAALTGTSTGATDPEAAAKAAAGKAKGAAAAAGASTPGRPSRPRSTTPTGIATGGLPYSLQNAFLEAEGTPGTADDMKALNDELAYVNRALAQKGLTPQARNELLQERESVMSQRDQITQAAASARKQAADEAARRRKQLYTGQTVIPAKLVKQLADAQRTGKPVETIVGIIRQEESALRRQAGELRREGAPASYQAKIAVELKRLHDEIQKAITDARKKRIAKLDTVPAALRLEEANAIANSASEERLAAIYRKEKAALDKQLVELKKIHATKNDILKNRQAAAALQKKIDAIDKQKKGDQAALARELHDAVAGLAQYAPNVTQALATLQGGPVVHVHQDFPSPPSADGRREAIYAHHAMLAAFDE